MDYLFLNKKKKTSSGIKKIIIFLIFLLFALISASFLLKYLFLPGEINLIEGKESKISIDIPVSAVTVSTDKPIYINNEKITDNKTVSVDSPIYLRADSISNKKMQLSLFGIPVKNVDVKILPNVKLIPCGNAVGVRINANGVVILGIDDVKADNDRLYSPCSGVLKTGDVITEINGTKINNKEELINILEKSDNNKLDITLKRDEKYIHTYVNTIKEKDSGKSKLGAWVRDSTQGIGTLTYYDPTSGTFGALGHGIADIDTKQLFDIKNGKIMPADIVDIKKGESGSPGELIGEIDTSQVLGSIKNNTDIGIYGTLSDSGIQAMSYEPMEIALKDEIKTGKAEILSNIDGRDVRSYEIEIESINRFNIDEAKGMIIRITDKELLAKTNGIIQGMSGSPIIQNGKIVGAVTHVFVREPARGYAIFIENMLRKE
ncbi:MAG: SpoIVB peptidase [Firmicutes bacterium]|nr:SpoIVB peptidase [Bacillota bacterium]